MSSCGTRALKNARRIQSVAPNVIEAKEPLAGFISLVPLDILQRFHLMSNAELAAHPELLAASKALRAADARKARVSSPLFHGTLYFVRMIWFQEASGAEIAVNIGDINTATQYADNGAQQHPECPGG